MAAQALATAAFFEGKYALAFPFFGAERRGAPVLAFTRVDDKVVRDRSQVYNPDYVVVLDERLFEIVDVLEGLKECGIAILNSPKRPQDLQLSRSVDAATVEATEIAIRVMGAAITNSAILGAVAKATGLVSIDSVRKGIMAVFGSRLGKKVGEKNAQTAVTAYEATRIGRARGGRHYGESRKWLPQWNEMPLGLATRATRTEAGWIGPGSSVENKTGSWRTFAPALDVRKCTNCLLCWFYCPDGAIRRLKDVVEIDYEYCKGCGVCAVVCAPKAIAMLKSEELENKGSLESVGVISRC